MHQIDQEHHGEQSKMEASVVILKTKITDKDHGFKYPEPVMHMGQCHIWGTNQPKEPHRRKYVIWIWDGTL